MSLSELPAKMLERTESYNEAQLSAAVELTKLVCQLNKAHTTEEEVFRTFFRCYDKIKEITPAALDKIKHQGLTFKSMLIGTLTVITIVGITLYITFFMRH